MAATEGLPQGGPPPPRSTCRAWRLQRGHRPIEPFEELANFCEDAGPTLELHLPGARGRTERADGDGKVQLTLFMQDRGYVYAESAPSIIGLDSLAIDALAKLRAMGLVA